MPTPMSRAVTLVRLKTLLWKIRGGRMAFSPMRRSTATKATSDSTDRAIIDSASGLPQPQSRPFSASSRPGTTVVVSSPAPRKSIGAEDRLRGRDSRFTTTTAASRPSGTLRKKIQRQPSIPSSVVWPAKVPPMTGPRTLLMPKTARK